MLKEPKNLICQHWVTSPPLDPHGKGERIATIGWDQPQGEWLLGNQPTEPYYLGQFFISLPFHLVLAWLRIRSLAVFYLHHILLG